MDIESLIAAIDQLSPEEREQVKKHLIEPSPPTMTPQERIAVLDSAFDELRQGLSQEEIEALAQAMSAKIIDPRAWTQDNE